MNRCGGAADEDDDYGIVVDDDDDDDDDDGVDNYRGLVITWYSPACLHRLATSRLKSTYFILRG